jgi:hypothetical protein
MHVYTQKPNKNRVSGAIKLVSSRLIFPSFAILFVLLPLHQASATSGIANDVLAACAPNPTVPDVNSCSACHSTTNNRGPNDLTTAGQWALSTATFMNFCPNATPPPAPTPTPSPTPSPTPGMGMSSQPPPGTGMGMGKGGDDDDDDDYEDDDDDYEDDDDDYEDDDDDGGSASSFKSSSSSFRRFSRRSRD